MLTDEYQFKISAACRERQFQNRILKSNDVLYSVRGAAAYRIH